MLVLLSKDSTYLIARKIALAILKKLLMELHYCGNFYFVQNEGTAKETRNLLKVAFSNEALS
jgi:hypothetical protein